MISEREASRASKAIKESGFARVMVVLVLIVIVILAILWARSNKGSNSPEPYSQSSPEATDLNAEIDSINLETDGSELQEVDKEINSL